MPSAFERYYAFNQVTEWASAYLDFKRLKKKLKGAQFSNDKRRVSVIHPTTVNAEFNSTESPLDSNAALNIPLMSKETQMSKEEWIQSYLEAMDHDLDMVNKFFIAKWENLQKRIENIDSFDDHFGSIGSVLDEIANRSMASSLQAFLKDMLLETQYLHHYSQLNYTAARKIYKKIDKRFGVSMCDDLTDKLKAMEFMDDRSIQKLADQIRLKYATYFTQGDETKATSQLKIVQRDVDPRTLFRFGLQLGIIMTLLALIGIVAVLPNHFADGYVRDRFYVVLPVFRGFGLVILWLWCWGVLTFLWSRSGIAYAYIFDMNPKSELGYVRVFKSASFLSIGFLISFLFFFTSDRTGFRFINVPSEYYPLVLCAFTLMMVFSPPGAFHFKSRSYFLKTLCRVVVAPFGDGTTFRDFFLADVLTSMTKVLFDVVFTGCYYISGDFARDGNCVGEYEKTCSCNNINKISLPILSVLPFWFRLQQCLRKFYDTHETKHLFNAFKYLTGISVVLSACVGNFDQMNMELTLGARTPMRWLWFSMLLFSSLYNSWWDTFMDWGVFTWENGCLRMRKKRAFRYKFVYVLSVIFNIFARFAWAISITPRYIEFAKINHQVFILIISVIEVLRRAHWALYRVEYEYVVNPEKERDITKMPQILSHQHDDQSSIARKSCRAVVVVFNVIIVISVAVVIVYFYKEKKWA